MGLVSQSFKKAIKSSTREIKGYVEIITENYIDKNNYIVDGGSEIDISDITSYSQISNNQRVVNKYASFEKDYFLLDGSFILPSLGENINSGYISNSISYEENEKHFNGELLNVEIRINSQISMIEGITLYFDDDIYPTDLYYYNNGEKIEVHNDSNVLNIFDTINFVDGYFSIYFERLNNPNRRLRIAEIDLGITNVYKKTDLINFTINESIDVLKEQMPINECDVVLNNTNYQFDSINPTGIAKYLDGAIVKPYIGVLTDDAGVEYCPCGLYYVDSWKSNSETTTTLFCSTIFKKMSDNYSYVSQISTGFMDADDYFNYMFQLFGISNYEVKAFFDKKKDNCFICDTLRGKTTQLDNLRDVLILCNIIGYVNRFGEIIIDKLSDNIVDEILLNQCKDIPIIEIQNINSKIIINEVTSNIESSDNSIVFQKTIEVTGEKNQTVIVDFGKNYSTTLASNGIAPDYLTTRPGLDFYFIQYNSDILQDLEESNIQKGTSTITITKNGEKVKDTIPTTFEVGGNGNTIEITNSLFNATMQSYIDRGSATDGDGLGMLLSRAMKNTANFIKEQNHQYKIEIDYNGDPSLEAGNLINVETRYGMKKIRIQELTLNFNGALSGTIKGVGD